MGSRGRPILFLDHVTRGGERSASRPGRSLPPGKTQYPLHMRLGGPHGPVWTSAENFAPTAIRSVDRPAHSQSLYRLSYQAHNLSDNVEKKSVLTKQHTASFQLPGCHGLEYEGDVMPYDLVKQRRFRETCYIRYHGTRGGNTFQIARTLLSDQAASHI